MMQPRLQDRLSRDGRTGTSGLDALGVPKEPSARERYVREMFDAISPRYDLLNRLLSLGQDVLWRRRAARLAVTGLPRGSRVLDLATGTGDLAKELLEQLGPGGEVVGVDFALQMMEHARRKLGRRLALVAGNGLLLPFASGAFGAATMAFAARNVVDLRRCFEEMRRVVRPGGRVVCLELSHPRGRLWPALYHFYFYRIVPKIGQWFIGRRDPYRYLPHSLTPFPDQDRLRAIMQSAGLERVRYYDLLGGIAAIHVGEVPPGAGTAPAEVEAREWT